MGSVCLPSDALLQHLPSYLAFSYLGRGISLHGCSSTAQPLLLTLDDGGLLTTARPDLQRWMAPLRPSCAATTPWTWSCPSRPPPLALGVGLLLPVAALASGLRLLLPAAAFGLGRRPWPRTLPLASDAAPGLGRGVAPPGCRPWHQTRGISSQRSPPISDAG